MADDVLPDYRARAASGAAVLQRWYRQRTGLWKSTGWWNAANALTAVIRYTRYTGDRAYLDVIPATFAAAVRKNPGFVNRFYDDTLWWGLAWVAAGDLTGDERYLAAAAGVFTHCLTGWDDTCGGGLWWNQDRRYKNAITNELFLTLAAQLHQRAPGDGRYLDWALRSWAWLRDSGMIGPSGLVNDGLTPACVNNQGTTWTYNQGVILGGLCALHEISGEPGYLAQAQVIADATLRSLTNDSGVLVEPCGPRGCDGDQTQFKGIFVRYLHELCGHSSHRPAYRAFLLGNADAAWAVRNPKGQFGASWTKPFDRADASRQSSALEVLIAAAALA